MSASERRVLASARSWYSRPIAPTRRIAVGRFDERFSTSAIPWLVGGVVAHCVRLVTEEVAEELDQLVDDLISERRVAQPRVRHRLQTDRVGLYPVRYQLFRVGSRLVWSFQQPLATPSQHMLGMLYLSAQHPHAHEALLAAKLGLGWTGAIEDIVDALDQPVRSVRTWDFDHQQRWAARVLDLSEAVVDRPTVMRAYRRAVRSAHPDMGGSHVDAAVKLERLNDARQILLAAC